MNGLSDITPFGTPFALRTGVMGEGATEKAMSRFQAMSPKDATGIAKELLDEVHSKAGCVSDSLLEISTE